MRPLRILLVENGPADSSAIEKSLDESDLEVDLDRISGADQIGRLRGSYDLALVDWHGLENPDREISALFSEFAELPVIALLDSTDVELIRGLIRTGRICDWVLRSDLGRLPLVIDRELFQRDAHMERIAALRSADEAAGLARAVLDSVQDGVVALDEDGTCSAANRRAVAILGATEEDLVGSDFHLLVHGPEQVDHCRLLEAIRFPGTVFSETEFTGRDRSSLVRFRTVPLGRTEKGVVITFQDLTEEVRLRERFDEISRLDSLGKTAGKIAHEFNNVLMGIRPFGEVILRRAAGDALLEDAARRIEYSVARGVRVTSEILRFARPAELDLTSLEVSQILRDLEKETSALLSGSGCTLKIQDFTNGSIFEVDRYQLIQVLVNLVMNALDAMPSGEVTIRATARDDSVDIEVHDTGVGITQEDLKLVFEPMFTTKSRGTGLGLAVARQIVVAHRGTIQAESEPDRGSTFTVRLPLKRIGADQ
ncbi:MAG: PAS domain S-box protein [Acidobacteria bacterium]|nr:PAS domain S-box protein [Acidobacteriota bacterium]